MFSYFRRHRRQRTASVPLKQEQWRLIDCRVPQVAGLADADRLTLGGIVQVLLDEKTFKGCGGLEMTDEIRLTIAAQAALLLLRQDEPTYYPSLRSILVYPSAFSSKLTRQLPNGLVVEGDVARQGESWYRGAIVLSWDDVVRGAADDGDGHNVTLHEFAHQLDAEDGAVDGAPSLPSRARYRSWAAVLSEEYESLANELHRGHATLLDAYGSTSPAEFFAVATELFFERPQAMLRAYPELYKQLEGFYQQDPAAG